MAGSGAGNQKIKVTGAQLGSGSLAKMRCLCLAGWLAVRVWGPPFFSLRTR